MNASISRHPVLTLRSEISEVEITCLAGPQSAVFQLTKGTRMLSEITAPYPAGFQPGGDAVFVLSYSSATRKVRSIVNDRAGPTQNCNLGWLDAREFGQPIKTHCPPQILVRWCGLYDRLISSN